MSRFWKLRHSKRVEDALKARETHTEDCACRACEDGRRIERANPRGAA